MKALQRARRGSNATGQKAAGKRTATELGGTSTDPTGIEVMVGEDDEAYIHSEAAAQPAGGEGADGGQVRESTALGLELRLM